MKTNVRLRESFSTPLELTSRIEIIITTNVLLSACPAYAGESKGDVIKTNVRLRESFSTPLTNRIGKNNYL